MDEKSQSSLNTLSLICHAVYLDHNYNATLPPDSPTRVSPPPIAAPQINGLPGSSLYSPGNGKLLYKNILFMIFLGQCHR